MKLSSAIYQLSLRFDVERLQHEVAQLPDGAWATHPNGYAGNSSLVLVSVDGTMNDDFAIAGSMQPSRWLLRCPYLMQVLASLNAPISRTRLMRLDGRSTVPKHRDSNYHWYRRTRVHIPIVTHSSVEFVCDNEARHFAAGEAWTFDNSRPHEVLNPARQSRIHLVADTRGSDAFWKLLTATTDVPASKQASNQFVPFRQSDEIELPVEPYRFEVLSDSEMSELTCQIESHVSSDSKAVHELKQLRNEWSSVFKRFGHSVDGEMAYASCITRLKRVISDVSLSRDAAAAFDVISTMLRTTNRTVTFSGNRHPAQRAEQKSPRPINLSEVRTPDNSTRYVRTSTPNSKVPPLPALQRTLEAFSQPASILEAVDRVAEDARPSHTAFATAVESLLKLRLLEPVANFHRPVFIVSAPRSGSTLLFETLSQAKDAWTIGDESHHVIESISSLHPRAHDWASNRLTADDSTSEVMAKLHAQFTRRLRNRCETAWNCNGDTGCRPVRLLAKTPKDSLRIPFLKAVFPNARFIYLHRNPEANISSIMEGWRSRRFVTYANLPGWASMPWSFLLPPDWQHYRDATLAEIAAFQWKSANQHILNDLSSIPADDCCTVRYDEFINNPQQTMYRLCQFADWPVDQHLDEYVSQPLPLSRYTLSEPSPTKWKKNEDAVRAILPTVQETVEQFEAQNHRENSKHAPKTQALCENGVAA